MKLRVFSYALSAVFLFYVAAALLFGIFNHGSLAFLILALFFALLPWIWRRSRGHRWFRRVFVGTTSLTAAIVLFLSALMAWQGYFQQPPADGRVTLIVLGAKVVGTQPSTMLKYRLEAALNYLQANPQSDCIVSGGQGADEIMSEAAAMAAWLMEHGIAENRIILEDASTNTQENIGFSMALLPEDTGTVAIVTDGFHQLRASIHARELGIKKPRSIPALTPWGLFPVYWMRDLGGVPLTWIGYRLGMF